MLKRLCDEYDFPIEKILLKEHKRLDLNLDEVTVLVTLANQTKKVFSLAKLSKATEYTKVEMGEIIESLLKKSYLSIELQPGRDNIIREIFSLDKLFYKIETIFEEDKINEIREKNQNYISKTIGKLEELFGRALTSFELDTVRGIYDQDKYTYEQVLQAINQARLEKRLSIQAVERFLILSEKTYVQVDDNMKKALDDIFKSIK